MSGEFETVQVELTWDELRYVISSGPALCQHISEQALATHCGFNKQQIIEFTLRMRAELDRHGRDM